MNLSIQSRLDYNRAVPTDVLPQLDPAAIQERSIAAMAKIGVGRNAAEFSFLIAFGWATMNGQSHSVQ